MIDNRSNNVQIFTIYVDDSSASFLYTNFEKNKHNLHTKKAQIHTLKTVPGGV